MGAQLIPEEWAEKLPVVIDIAAFLPWWSWVGLLFVAVDFLILEGAYRRIAAQQERLRALSVESLPSDILEHHRDVRDATVSRLLEATPLTDNGHEIGTWVWSRDDTLACPGGEVSIRNDEVHFTLFAEQSHKWAWLKEHLTLEEHQHLWDAIETWREAECSDLRSRRRLFEWLQEHVCSTLKLSCLAHRSTGTEKGIIGWYFERLYERLFRRAVGMSIPECRVEDFEIRPDRSVWLNGNQLAAKLDIEERTALINYFVDAASLDVPTSLREELTGAYQRINSATELLRAMTLPYASSPSLPRGPKCASCRIATG